MIVYKVVRASDEPDIYLSAVVRGSRWELRYIPNQPTVPPDFAPDAKLLAFTTLPDAIAFMNDQTHSSDMQIWLAETESFEPVERVVFLDEKRHFRQFWRKCLSDYYTRRAPEGAVACPSITLLERI